MPTTDRVTVQPNGELAALRAENERLKAQLAERRTANVQAPKPFLTEGERQDLITFGRSGDLTLSQARRDFPDADLDDASDVAKENDAKAEAEPERAGVRGIDFVYPSVKPGFIDPAVAGTPGINGPTA